MNRANTYVAYTSLLICMTTQSCKSAPSNMQTLPPVTPSAQAPASDSMWVTMERHPCFGTCPVYSLHIGSDGAVVYNGIRFVSTMGRATDMLPRASITELQKAFDDAHFTSLPSKYTFKSPACSDYITDMPTVITTITTAGKTTSVEHDRGCTQAPAALTSLENKIDSIARTARWTRMK